MESEMDRGKMANKAEEGNALEISVRYTGPQARAWVKQEEWGGG
jgi:hypothetical protein